MYAIVLQQLQQYRVSEVIGCVADLSTLHFIWIKELVDDDTLVDITGTSTFTVVDNYTAKIVYPPFLGASSAITSPHLAASSNLSITICSTINNSSLVDYSS